MKLDRSRITSRRILSASILLALASSASAETGADLLLKVFPENKNYSLNLDAAYVFNGEEEDHAQEDFQLNTFDASGAMKLTLNSVIPGIDKSQPRAGFDVTVFDIHDDANVIPDNLTDMSVGVGFGVLSYKGWLAGVWLGVGYAGENVFNDGNAIYGKAGLGIGYEIDKKSSLAFFIDYDGNRTLMPDVPLPGAIYRRHLTDELQMGFGLPFSDILWTPSEQWELRLTYFIPDSFDIEANYHITKKFGIFGALNSTGNAFNVNSIADSDERLLVYESR
ncbi:MAG TPA: hypothetical protein PK402_01625, partial [Tepidisphaeraceae bacterium]|nr:hypothetical protein [Tepidisphaeraceae bacterium]